MNKSETKMQVYITRRKERREKRKSDVLITRPTAVEAK